MKKVFEAEVNMENIKITKSQEVTLCRILKMAERFDLSHGAGEYEIKRYVVDDCRFFLSVVLEVGLVGDEGTLASVFCRNRVHLFVGKKGGIKYPCTGKKGGQITKTLAGRSLLGVSIDQKI